MGMQAEEACPKKRFEDPSQMLDVGTEYIKMKKYWKAVEIFELIIEDKPRLTHLAKAYNDCGIAYAELGIYEKAIANLEEAINLERYLIDFGARAYRNLGRVYELMGDTEKAKKNIEKAEVIEEDLYHYWVTRCDELE